MNKRFIEIDVTGSTNNYAMQLIQNGAGEHGTAVFAHEQTNGKGQRGKEWFSNSGENIILSVMLYTKGLPLTNQILLNMATALSGVAFLSFYAGSQTSVKWPNDLYWSDRKAGGILIENIIKGNEWQWAVVGLGININQTVFGETLRNAVSLKQITGKKYNPVDLAKELWTEVMNGYKRLLAENPEKILEEYNDVLYAKDKKITLKKNNVVFECLVKGVNKYGQLITERGVEELFESGEVRWVI